MSSPFSRCRARFVAAWVLVFAALHPCGALAAELPPPAPSASPAPSAPPAPPPPADEKVPFGLLVERVVGEAIRPVVFAWRKSALITHAEGGQILELNNFQSTRYALLLRLPSRRVNWHLGFAWVNTVATPSSRLVSLTPYRQEGRPSRFETDSGLDFPIAEGIVTNIVSLLPPGEMVLALQARLRYLSYPGTARDLTWAESFKAWLSPVLTDDEQDKLQEKRLPGMKVAAARANFLVGLRHDLFFRNGMVFSQSALLAIPLLSGSPGLGFWWDLSLGVGIAL